MKAAAVASLLLSASFAAIPVGGCSGLAKEYPERRFHDVECARTEPARAAAAGGPILQVHRFEVSQRFEGVEIVRRTGDLTWEPDYYDVLLVPPDSIVTEEARKWISRSGLFAHVIDASTLGDATYFLQGMVTSFYGDLRGGETRSVIEAQLFLVDPRVDPPAIALSGTYAEAVGVANDSSAAIVAGWGSALERILSRFEEDVAKTLLERR